MYKNIGGKIKTLAIVCFALLAIVTFFGGIALWYDYYDGAWLITIFGPVLAYVSSLSLYGFGPIDEIFLLDSIFIFLL